MAALLDIQHQTVRFPTPRGPLVAVDNVSLRIEAGEALGIVGESGCGKSVLSRSILRLQPGNAYTEVNSRVIFEDQDLNTLGERALRRLRGPGIAMVFQDPMTALNPTMTIGQQLAEGPRVHLRLGRRAAWRQAVELLDMVGLPQPAQKACHYPHQLSGGMQQRVAIAIALACEPSLLIADEPTTALDVTIQAEILDLLQYEQHRRNMAMILISHDLAIVSSRTNRIAVMYAGRIVETGASSQLLASPRMPYTRSLLDSVPTITDEPGKRLEVIEGRPPDLVSAPAGCAFAARCRWHQQRCKTERPVLTKDPLQQVACWYPLTRGRAR